MTANDATSARNPAAESRITSRLRLYLLPILFLGGVLGMPPGAVHDGIIVTLAALPWALLGSMLIAGDICRAPGNKLRKEFAVFIVLTALAFGYRAFADMRIVEIHAAIVPALGPAAALFGAMLMSLRAVGAGMRNALIAALLAAPLYGYGAALYTNAVLDTTQPQFFETRVIGKRVLLNIAGSQAEGLTLPGVLGRRLPPLDWYQYGKEVQLRAWGPVAEPRWEPHLPWGLYEFAGPSTRICLDFHAGALSIPWYEIKSCRKERKECVKEPDCKAWLEDMQQRLSNPPPIVKRG